MWIILKKDDELFKMINTDVCACFQNVNGGLGFEHGNYSRVIPTTDIADVQDILNYIAYCLKQKKYICEVLSKDYEDWKSRLYIDKEEELVKGFDKYLIDKEYERITEDLAKIGLINPISPEEIK